MRLIARESVEAALANQVGDVAAIDIRIKTGSPLLRLFELIDGIDADRVVMRAHRAQLGSVTRRARRNAACDVLICRPAPEDAGDQAGSWAKHRRCQRKINQYAD